MTKFVTGDGTTRHRSQGMTKFDGSAGRQHSEIPFLPELNLTILSRMELN